MATQKIKSLPITVGINLKGAHILYGTEDGTFKEHVARFRKLYQTKSGLPAGVLAIAVVDLVSRKVVSTVRNPLTLTQGKPTP